MAFEKCARCGEESTPWGWIDDVGHVCLDCYLEYLAREKRDKNKVKEE